MKIPEPVQYAAWALFGWLWTPWQWLRHPRRELQQRRKWKSRPAVGAWVEDCRGKVLQVVSFGETNDDLLLDDGSSASWMHCCERAQAPGDRGGDESQ